MNSMLPPVLVCSLLLLLGMVELQKLQGSADVPYYAAPCVISTNLSSTGSSRKKRDDDPDCMEIVSYPDQCFWFEYYECGCKDHPLFKLYCTYWGFVQLISLYLMSRSQLVRSTMYFNGIIFSTERFVTVFSNFSET